MTCRLIRIVTLLAVKKMGFYKLCMCSYKASYIDSHIFTQVRCMIMFCNLLKIFPRAMNLRSSKRGVGVFLRVDISLESTLISHIVGPALFLYTCSDSAMQFLSCTCVSLPSFVPLAHAVLFRWCFLLKTTACTLAKISGVL